MKENKLGLFSTHTKKREGDMIQKQVFYFLNFYVIIDGLKSKFIIKYNNNILLLPWKILHAQYSISGIIYVNPLNLRKGFTPLLLKNKKLSCAAAS